MHVMNEHNPSGNINPERDKTPMPLWARWMFSVIVPELPDSLLFAEQLSEEISRLERSLPDFPEPSPAPGAMILDHPRRTHQLALI